MLDLISPCAVVRGTGLTSTAVAISHSGRCCVNYSYFGSRAIIIIFYEPIDTSKINIFIKEKKKACIELEKKLQVAFLCVL